MSAGTAKPSPPPRIRRDGWTGEWQLAFLAALADRRSVAAAAASAGMSRESAYRLRNRRDGALFALLWDRALAPPPLPCGEAGQPEHHIGNATLIRRLGTVLRWHPLCGPVVGAGCIVTAAADSREDCDPRPASALGQEVGDKARRPHYIAASSPDAARESPTNADHRSVR